MKTDLKTLSEAFDVNLEPNDKDKDPNNAKAVILNVLCLHASSRWDLDEADHMGRAVTVALKSEDPSLKFISIGGSATTDIKNSNGATPMRLTMRTSDPQKVLQTLSEIYAHNDKAMFLGLTDKGDLLMPQKQDPWPSELQINLDAHPQLHSLIVAARNEARGVNTEPAAKQPSAAAPSSRNKPPQISR